MHLSKGQKYQWFLSPMFLRPFPAIMGNQITVDWNTISGIYNRTPILPITLIDTEILDDWFAHPSVWDVPSDLQHARCVLAPFPLYAADPIQGSTCHSVWGILCLYSHLPSTHEPVQWPDVPEEHQGRLRSPGSGASQANISSSTMEGQVPVSTSYQQQPRHRSRSFACVHCRWPPRG